MSNREPQVGMILWQDLTVANAQEVKEFYSQVVGWQARPLDMGAYHDFEMILPGRDKVVAGICHARGSNAALPPQWLTYISVADVNESVRRCLEHGGKVVDGPRLLGNNQFCVIEDPAGAVVALMGGF